MEDRERWDAKYAAAEGPARDEPDAFVVRALERLGPPPRDARRALDLAAGLGRHAILAARRGWDVTAWDVSPVGLERLRQRAAADGVEVATSAVDVLATPRPDLGEPFDLVICVLFLDRDLLARLHELVVPGGHLVFATATVDLPGDKPPKRYRLERGELAQGVAGFDLVEHVESDGRAGVLARRPA